MGDATMSVTYPPELLPIAGPDEDVEVVVRDAAGREAVVYDSLGINGPKSVLLCASSTRGISFLASAKTGKLCS
jgi:hypothetical protein